MSAHSSPDHISGAKDSSVTETSQKVWGFFGLVFTILMFIFLIWATRGCIGDRKEKARVAEAAALERARTNPPSATTTPAMLPPFSMKMVNIPPGGVPLLLHPGWRQCFAMGGDITVTTQNGKVYKDQPGANNTFGSQRAPEIYIFRADPDGSKRQVSIYNRW